MDCLLLILTLKYHTQTLSKRFPHNIQGPGSVLDPQFPKMLGFHCVVHDGPAHGSSSQLQSFVNYVRDSAPE